MNSIFTFIHRLNYPNGKFEKLKELRDETIVNAAIDFSSTFKPQIIQMAMIPKDSKKSSLTFDMDYKPTSSKATLNFVI